MPWEGPSVACRACTSALTAGAKRAKPLNEPATNAAPTAWCTHSLMHRDNSCRPVSSMVLVAGLAIIAMLGAAAAGMGWSIALGPPADSAAGCAARSGLMCAAVRCLFVSGVCRRIGLICILRPCSWSKHTRKGQMACADTATAANHLLLFKQVHGVQLVVWRKADTPPHALAVSLALLR